MWYTRLQDFLITIDFKECNANSSLFIYKKDIHRVFLFIYVDNIVITRSDESLVERLINKTGGEFSFRELRKL